MNPGQLELDITTVRVIVDDLLQSLLGLGGITLGKLLIRLLYELLDVFFAELFLRQRRHDGKSQR